MKIFCSVVLFVTLAGCASVTWYRDGTTQQEANKDHYACMQESQQQTYGGVVGPYGGSAYGEQSTNMPLYKSCMHAKGYSETRPPASQKSSQDTNSSTQKAKSRNSYLNPNQDKESEEMENAMERIMNH